MYRFEFLSVQNFPPTATWESDGFSHLTVVAQRKTQIKTSTNCIDRTHYKTEKKATYLRSCNVPLHNYTTSMFCPGPCKTIICAMQFLKSTDSDIPFLPWFPMSAILAVGPTAKSSFPYLTCLNQIYTCTFRNEVVWSFTLIICWTVSFEYVTDAPRLTVLVIGPSILRQISLRCALYFSHCHSNTISDSSKILLHVLHPIFPFEVWRLLVDNKFHVNYFISTHMYDTDLLQHRPALLSPEYFHYILFVQCLPTIFTYFFI